MTARQWSAKLAPWLHAFVIGIVAALAALEHVIAKMGYGWGVVTFFVVSRVLGALVSGAASLPMRRAPLNQVMDDLRIGVRRLVGATHGLSNHVTTLVGEIDLLVERLNHQKERE